MVLLFRHEQCHYHSFSFFSTCESQCFVGYYLDFLHMYSTMVFSLFSSFFFCSFLWYYLVFIFSFLTVLFFCLFVPFSFH